MAMTPEGAAAVLNIDVNATATEVRAAARLRERMTHPDRYAGAPAKDVEHAHAEFIRVGVARDVLLEELRRKEQQQRPAADTSAPRPQPSGRSTPPGHSPGQANRPPNTPPPEHQQTSERTKFERGLVIGVIALITAAAVYAAVAQSVNSNRPETGPAAELEDTEWRGTDSEGVDTVFLLDSDRTVDVTLEGEEYDEAADTWTVDDSGWLEIRIDYEDGPATYSGQYVDYDTPIVMTVSGYGDGWTLTVR